ncbi:MAG: VWA domain-containing protein, partial [bacterium]|nr:VWA domain-containing protein [bacterium]
GTNQCTGLSGTARTNCQAAVGVANLDWSRQICGVACDATCPPSSIAAPLRFGGTTSLGSTLTAEAQFSAGNTRYAQVDACRLLDAFRYDVELGSGVDVWPVPVSVVVVTDRSGSMYREVVTDCDGDGVRNFAGTCSGGDHNSQACTDDDECLGTPNGTCEGETLNDLRDHRMRCTRNAIKGDGGLLDKLAIARDPGDVRVALVSYGTTVQTDSELRDVATPTERQALKDIVSGYNGLGGTATHLAIDRAAEILNADTSAQTKVIILLSDGIANNMAATTTAATAFKAPGGHRYLFTIAYPIPRAGMTGWSSNTTSDTSFAFSGDDLESFYEQIVGAIAGVSITLLPGGSGDSPS